MAKKIRAAFALVPLLAGTLAGCVMPTGSDYSSGPEPRRSHGTHTAAPGGAPPASADEVSHETPHYRICSEAEVGGIVSAINDSSIAMATAAKDKATSEDLKSYFGRVVSEQERMKDAWQDALAKANVTPKESGMSRHFEASAEKAAKRIAAEPAGAEWDQSASTHAFMGRLMILSLMNRVLLPSTDDRGLRIALRAERATLVDQLDDAAMLQTSLGGGCAAESAKPSEAVPETAKPSEPRPQTEKPAAPQPQTEKPAAPQQQNFKPAAPRPQSE